MSRQKEFRREFLRDILIAAVEGGIGYWSQAVSYNPDEGTAVIYDVGAGEEIQEPANQYSINLVSIEQGVQRIVEGQVQFLRADIRATVATASRLNDATDIDSTLADVIVQVALFGDILYA